MPITRAATISINASVGQIHIIRPRTAATMMPAAATITATATPPHVTR